MTFEHQAAEVEFHDAGQGVFWLAIRQRHGGNTLTPALIGELVQALRTLREAPSLKVLVLKGLPQCFLQGGRESVDAAVQHKLVQAVATFPSPVIAAMQGDALGAGFLLAALCDAMVCSRQARYGFTSAAAGLFPTAEEERLISQRFGQPRAEHLLYAVGEATGQALHEQHWSCPIVAAADVEACAQKLAGHLAGKSGRSLRLLKRHLAGPMVALSEALGACTPSPADAAEGVQRRAADLVQVIRLRAPAHAQLAGGQPLVAELCAALAHLNDAVKTGALEARAIVLVSEHPQFLPGLNGDAQAVRQARQALLESALPIVTVLGGEDGSEVSGAAWLIAQCCDSVLHLRDGRYSAAGLLQDTALANAACALFTQRLGLQMGKEILLSGAAYRGGELQQRTGLPVVADLQEGQARAVAQAQGWAAFPAQTLQAWKQRRCQSLQEALQAADWPASAASDLPADTEAESATAEPLVLQSTVIRATRHPHGIVVVRMEERAQKNLFSEEFIRGMREVLGRIQQCDTCKVVILTGFDKYFASGGTREALLAIQQGKARFTDDSTYLWALQCPVPVIAALQGHAVGGGLSVGLFADFVLLSQESQCLSPYMNYGFTPGAGATLIVPERLGQDLGRESLLTGLEYAGSELRARGVALPVVPRKAIEPAAMELARALARHTREGLVALKHRFNRDIQHRLAQNTQQELAMHEQTFVGQAQTLQQIHSSFSPAPTVSNPQGAETLAQIAATLQALLAQELQMSEADIDHDIPFIDLGLDSITGVTWMRKVNERYGTAIPAIKVYSHPDLTQMSRFVQDQVAKAGAVAPAAPPGAGGVVPQMPQERQEPQKPAIPHELQPDLTATLKALLAEELHMQPEQVDEDTPFIDLGLDSITGVTWTRKINERYGTAIAAIKVYSHPTLTQLSAHVREQIGLRHGPRHSLPHTPAPMPRPAPAAPEPARPAPPRETGQGPLADSPRPDAGTATGGFALKARPKLASWRGNASSRTAPPQGSARRAPAIAVIGMAGRFPMAGTLQQYWDNIASAKNCISEMPAERWDISAYYREGDATPGKTNAKWMGLLEDHDRFDPLFFDISPKEALSMDPQQRVFLQACWHAIEAAGYAPRSLSGSKCGVFAGCGPGDYHLLSRDLQISALGFTGGDTAILAARVSYLLNLQGPCLSIETACSSSLVAMATACDSLAAGNCDLALAGGVYIACGPDLHVKTAQTGMLSRAGQCFTFDQRADGFVPGEGVGVLLLKRLEEAEASGDIILGVIEGWGVNQDGKTNGITAPNPEAQTRLQRDVYDRFGIDPGGIQLVEAHGTGTKLGDPIEVDALKQSFAAYTQKAGYCALGSVKTNIGHCFTAAGAASVIKVLLALEHEQLPPTINFQQLNEHIVLDRSPFFVNDRLRSWDLQGADRRRAAVSGFGFGGTNAHLVIGQHRGATRAQPAALTVPPSVPPTGAVIVPLSARTPQQLRQKALDLIEFLRTEGARADLASVAHTLQIGREAMEERAAFLVRSSADLVTALRAFADGERGTGNRWQGQVSSHKDALRLLQQDADLRESLVAKWIAQQRFAHLAELWVKGLDLDWQRLHSGGRAQRVRLPLYPFARDRYWIEDVLRHRNDAPAASATAARLHPLLHRNTSNFGAQRYGSTFDGSEALFADPQRDGPGVLPASACLEMARAAASDALTGQLVSAAVELRDVAWGQPFVVAAGRDLTTTVFATGNEGVEFEIHSGTGDDETVHCRGRVVFEDGLPDAAIRIPPRLLDGVLRSQRGTPASLDCLRIGSACPEDGVARVLAASDTRLDIDLCDAQGTVCAQIRGLALQSAPAGAPAAASAVAGPVTATTPVPATVDLPSRSELQQELKKSLADVLYLSPAEIQADRPFIELGLDSIVGVEWVGAINKKYGLAVTATKVYDYPNLLELSGFVEQELKSRRASAKPAQAEPPAPPAVFASVPPAAPPAAAAEPALSLRALQQELTVSLAKALYLEPSDIKADKPFVELGLDSIVGVEWVSEINSAYKLKINATRVYDYTNVAEFAAFLQGEILKTPGKDAGPAPTVACTAVTTTAAEPVVPPVSPAPAAGVPAVLARRAPAPRAPQRKAPPAVAPATGKIAIIGMSGRYPGAANLRQFWDNLVQGRNSITEIPPSRWDVSRYYDPDVTKEGKVYCKWLGMLDDMDCFDPQFFKISPAEAKTMDPQHRLFLQESYHAFEDAGYSGRTLSNQRCGVYLGLIGNEYARIVARNSSAAVDLTGNNDAIGAARVAYFLNLKGPAISIDTACSSSLVAIHLACQGLLSRETDMALAGGVTVYLEPEAYMGMCQAGMLSPDGQCKTLDDAANGFVPGEGAGAVVLKRLEDAERDNDFIYGVIVGSGINQDGRTNGITAPSVNSQIALERELYDRCGVHPDSVSYVEMHGTGTKLGDPIELEALATVFGEKTARRNFCALGSVKSNVGHTSGAAGVAAVQKALLCMQHRTLVPTLNVKKENTLFDFENSPFYVSRETCAWAAEPGAPRRAGVSSFGFSGTNAHLILEEYAAPVRAAGQGGEGLAAVILLSARTPEQLRQKAQDLLDFVGSEAAAKSGLLMDLAHTLMMGREILDERLVLVVGSLAELAEGLQAHLRGEPGIPGLQRGRVARDGEGVALVGQRADVAGTCQRSIASRDFATLAELWVAGITLEWAELYPDVAARRVSLPTYPFARHRYWVEERPGLAVGAAAATGAAAPAAKLHPLLHRNVSVLGEHGYNSTFTGDEPFVVALPLRPEDRGTQRTLPAAAYLEMARAAVERAVPGRAGFRLPTLQNVVWGRPLLATPGRQVNVALFRRSAEQIDFEIYSQDRADSSADEIVHCQGQAVPGPRGPAATRDLARLRAGMGRGLLARDAVHDRLGRAGWHYARHLQAIEAIHQGDGELLVQLQVPVSLAGTLGDYVLMPTLLDGALQSVIGLQAAGPSGPAGWALPTALAALHIEAPCTPTMLAWVRESDAGRAAPDRPRLDIDLTDPDGKLCARLQGVEYLWMPLHGHRAGGEGDPQAPGAGAAQPAVAPRAGRGVALGEPASAAPVAAPVQKRAAGKPARITLT